MYSSLPPLLTSAVCSGLSCRSVPQPLASPSRSPIFSPAKKTCNSHSAAKGPLVPSPQPSQAAITPCLASSCLPAPACPDPLSPAVATSPAGFCHWGPDETFVFTEAQLLMACVPNPACAMDATPAEHPLGRRCRGRGDGHGEEARPYLHPQAVSQPQGSLWDHGRSIHHPIHLRPSTLTPHTPSLWFKANTSLFVLLPGKQEHLGRGDTGDARAGRGSRAPPFLPPQPGDLPLSSALRLSPSCKPFPAAGWFLSCSSELHPYLHAIIYLLFKVCRLWIFYSKHSCSCSLPGQVKPQKQAQTHQSQCWDSCTLLRKLMQW